MPSLNTGEPSVISLDFMSLETEDPSIILIIESSLGHSMVHTSVNSKQIGYNVLDGKYTLSVEIPPLWLSPGLYSVYFKLITRIPRKRFLSERATLRVTGQFDKTGKTLLTPTVKWGLEDASREPRQLQNQNGAIETCPQS